MLIQTPYNETTSEIIGAAIDVHRILGPGLLESTYARCLRYELDTRRMRVSTEVSIPLSYKGMQLDQRYRIDLIVENTSCPIGLLINFNQAALVDGVHRIMNPDLRQERSGRGHGLHGDTEQRRSDGADR
jgi:hypothetical protein